MAEIRPLRALRYDPARVGDLSRVLCPPYDVLSADDEEALRARHPRNYVRLILPREEGGLDRYRAAAALLDAWRADGTLRLDPAPAFYFYEQEYRLGSSEPVRRRGIFALVRLHEFSEGVVLPHEQTLPAPREDRYRLLEATRAHFDPIFGLYSDPERAVDRLFERVAQGPPLVAAQDPDGVSHRLWLSEREQDLSAVASSLDGRWVLIADGHHRYESALRYARSQPASGAARPFDYVLMVLCNIDSGGLTVLPIHRVVRALPEFSLGAWLERLGAWFDVRPLELGAGEAQSAARVEAALSPHSGRGGAFVLAPASGRACLLTLRQGFDGERELGASVPAPLRRLDVTLAHTLLFERGLGISPDEQLRQTVVQYSKSAAAALAEVASGRAQAAVLLNPTPIEAVVEATHAGLRMPPKSTFFHPKLVSGLVIHPFA